MYRELLAMGASESDARRVAANSRCWWRNSRMLLNRAMPIAYFDRLGVPGSTSTTEPPGADPLLGGVAGERSADLTALYADLTFKNNFRKTSLEMKNAQAGNLSI